MKVYYFSSCTPNPQMIQDLGGQITEQFKGCIKDIHRRDGKIAFTEILWLGGCEIKACHMISADSIVVVDAPPVLQGDWIKAGIQTLLFPQIEQEVGQWWGNSHKYLGLLQINQIRVETSPWLPLSSAQPKTAVSRAVS